MLRNFFRYAYIAAVCADEFTTEYWKSVSRSELENSKKIFSNLKTGKAKNVIMLIGDGMSLGTSTAGRILIGQKLGHSGEEYLTSLDSMPHSGLVKTYSGKFENSRCYFHKINPFLPTIITLNLTLVYNNKNKFRYITKKKTNRITKQMSLHLCARKRFNAKNLDQRNRTIGSFLTQLTIKHRIARLPPPHS